MQLVAAIDGQQSMRAILCLFEGVVTGAADGYGRMADKPAATLLHLGPGLANGARQPPQRKARALAGGQHCWRPRDLSSQYDAPLTSDVDGVARPMSDCAALALAGGLADDGAAAVAAALEYPGKVATVIAPADHAWEPAGAAPPRAETPKPAPRASAPP